MIIRRLIVISFLVVFSALLYWGSVSLQRIFGDITIILEPYIQVHYFLSAGLFIALAAASTMLLAFSSVWLIPMTVPILGNFLTLAYLLSGWLIGAALSYFIGRYAGPPLLRIFITQEKMDHYRRYLSSHKRGFAVILLSRFILPSEVPGYTLGLMRYPFGKYFWATFLSETPFAILTVYAVDAIVQRKPWILIFWTAIWLLAAGTLWRVLRHGGFRVKHMDELL